MSRCFLHRTVVWNGVICFFSLGGSTKWKPNWATFFQNPWQTFHESSWLVLMMGSLYWLMRMWSPNPPWFLDAHLKIPGRSTARWTQKSQFVAAQITPLISGWNDPSYQFIKPFIGVMTQLLQVIPRNPRIYKAIYRGPLSLHPSAPPSSPDPILEMPCGLVSWSWSWHDPSENDDRL